MSKNVEVVSVSKKSQKTASKTTSKKIGRPDTEERIDPSSLIDRTSIFFEMPSTELIVNITGYRLRKRIIKANGLPTEVNSVDLRLITQTEQERSQIANVPVIAKATWNDLMEVLLAHKLTFKQALGSEIYPNLRAKENGGFDWQECNLMVNITPRPGKDGRFWMGSIEEVTTAPIEVEEAMDIRSMMEE